MTRLQDHLLDCQRHLQELGIDNPQLDVRLLFAHALHCDRAALLTQSERTLTSNEISAIDLLITRRAAREPIARILGLREFWGLPFGLNEATLEPRPDSETLIETALKHMKDNPSNLSHPLVTPAQAGAQRTENETLVLPPLDARLRRHDTVIYESLKDSTTRILDLGTGTGCLLLALLHEKTNATGLGIDRSARALEQATLNAARLDMAARVTFRQGNWLENVNEAFDVILCNPPYIPTSVVETLEPEVKNFDPVLALDGGADGLDPYRLIIPQLAAHLTENGLVLFEVGQGQAQDVAALLRDAGFENVFTAKDLGGVERCVGANDPHGAINKAMG